MDQRLGHGLRLSRSSVYVVEMNYLREAFSVKRWEGDSNERCGMEPCANGMKCAVGEWVKRNVLRWFGHMERKKSEEFVKKVFVSETEGPRRKGRPVVRWKEYMHERGADRGGMIEQARRECVDRERWRLFCCGHTLVVRS